MNDQEKQFIDAWRSAAPELERIRNEELRQLDESAGLKGLGAIADRPFELHGLAVMQSWFNRLRIKQLMAEVERLQRNS